MSYSFPRAQPRADVAANMHQYMLSLVPMHMELTDIPAHATCNFCINHDTGKTAFRVTMPAQWSSQIREYYPEDEPPTNMGMVNFLLDRIDELYLYRARSPNGQDWFVFDADGYNVPEITPGLEAILAAQ